MTEFAVVDCDPVAGVDVKEVVAAGTARCGIEQRVAGIHASRGRRFPIRVAWQCALLDACLAVPFPLGDLLRRQCRPETFRALHRRHGRVRPVALQVGMPVFGAWQYPLVL
jgi:hypothetical protein